MIDLKSRERKIIAACGAVLLAAIVHIALVAPALDKRAELEVSILEAEVQLKELRMLHLEYDQILEETGKIKRRMGGRPRDFALFSFLDHTASRLNLKNNLTSMKPSRRTVDSNLAKDFVEVRLEGISLANLVAYLHEIEKTGTAVAIANIRIQPESRLGGGLNVSMMVTALSPA